MGHYILALNCGSSSLKFTLFEVVKDNQLRSRMDGIVEEIGNKAHSRIKVESEAGKTVQDVPLPSHHEALLAVFDCFHKEEIRDQDIVAVGHRVVHGGTAYSSSVRIDGAVIDKIRELFPLAPLHNPPNLLGIEVAMKLLEGVPQVAVFDTAFHATLPEAAYRYAIPKQWYEDFSVRTYGFHGTSHMYVAKRGAKLLKIPYKDFYAITAHLGNGCSLTKIEAGKSTDTSMGFTPLEGVIMGTRSGDIDPAIIDHVAHCLEKKEGLSLEAAYIKVMLALNKSSGLLALGGTNRMQDIREKAEAGDVEAETVIAIYAYRIAKYIGAYWSTMPACQAIIFTAGVGENEGYVRKKVLDFLPALHFKMDEDANKIRKEEVMIGKSDSSDLSVLVIPTDEESVIAYDALYLGYLGTSAPD
ncbi:Acetate kinase [Petrocella atlantisensis]|uniref:Acetate kinase n=1 Tax=Petrocella atlantisensis TaxID=2173034 RepID=A0A3P7P332_9FIRM|nr:acetate kinase [Petrocella atlantisensis]VDN47940.1 Acetate kinase [Petrocella atlantisensis]